MSDCRNVISVDVNECNVTAKVQSRVYILQTDFKKLILGYANYREVMQCIKGNKHVKRSIFSRERNRKRDRRYKIANVIANTAKQLNAVMVLEDLPKQCPRGTSSTCPFCGSKLMRGSAPRRLKCTKCNVEMGRDIVVVLNLEKEVLNYKGACAVRPNAQ